MAQRATEDIELALDAAHKAKDGWGRTSVAERALILHRICELAPQGHVLMIDPHGEYGAAFGNNGALYDVNNLQMPYWLMNFEEHCEVFVTARGEDSQLDRDILHLVRVRRMLVSENMRGARRSVQQRGEVAPGPPGGEVLQRFTAGEHQNDDERRDVLAHGEGCDHRHHREDVEPDMPAKITDCTTLTSASPPRNRPTKALQKASSLRVMAPAFISSAARMNSGTASRIHDENSPFSICSAAVPRSIPRIIR